MAKVDQLEVFERKCTLFFFGYSGQGLALEDWLAREGMGAAYYRIHLERALRLIDSLPEEVDAPERSIREVVEDAEGCKVHRTSAGRSVDGEKSRSVRLHQMNEGGVFVPGSLRENERRVVDAISEYFQKYGVYPSWEELVVITGYSRTESESTAANVLRHDFSEPRYATRSFQIKKDSEWYGLIGWYQANVDTSLEMNVLRLSPMERETFYLAVSPRGNYYLTPEEIKAELIGKDIKVGDSFVTWFRACLGDIHRKIKDEVRVCDVRAELLARFTGNGALQDTARRLVVARIDDELHLSHGFQKEMAQEHGIPRGRISDAYSQAVKAVRERL